MEKANRPGVVVADLEPAQSAGRSRGSRHFGRRRLLIAACLLALRRHYDKTGAWPATLTEIEGEIPSEVLIDPLTKKPFLYRPTDEERFFLHNVGPDGIDEGGDSGDDYHFWPPSSRWASSVKY